MVELKRGLGYWSLLCLSIGSIMGTAIFFGAGIGASYSGNLALVAWVVLSVISIAIAMCFGELVGMFPKSGGVYEYSKQAYGRFFSFVIGWAAWLVGIISVVVLIVAALDLFIPDIFIQFLFVSIPLKLVLGALFIVLLNFIAFLGLEATSVMMVGFAVAILAVILGIVFGGFMHADFSYLAPFATHPLSSVLITIFFLTETFFGWEAATFLAEETKDARNTIPKAIIHATIIIAILGFFVMLVSLVNIPSDELKGFPSPTTAVVERIFGNTGAVIALAGIFIAFLGSAASGIFTMPRLTLALARDKLQLEQFNSIHPTFKTPYKAIVFQCILTILLLIMGFGSYEILISILVPLAIFMYVPVILSVSLLRFRLPSAERTFKVPFGKVIPVVIALFLFALIFVRAFSGSSEGFTLIRLAISLILVCLPLYLLVSLYYDPKMITDVNDLFSYVSLFTEFITYPKSLRNEIMSFLGDMKGSTILEFGCGVGTLTTSLLRKVGSAGSVYATHFSRNDLRIAGKRIEKAKWDTEGYVFGNATLIHDPQQFYRVHPSISRVNAIVSVGMLGYIQDLKGILKDMHAILSPKGKLCFVEYSDFFHIMPAVEWLSDDNMIEELFREAGFSVRVTRTRSLLWNRIFIYGFKYKDILVI